MDFDGKLKVLVKDHEALLKRKNRAVYVNGVYERYEFPVLTAAFPDGTLRHTRRVQFRSHQMG